MMHNFCNEHFMSLTLKAVKDAKDDDDEIMHQLLVLYAYAYAKGVENQLNVQKSLKGE